MSGIRSHDRECDISAVVLPGDRVSLHSVVVARDVARAAGIAVELIVIGPADGQGADLLGAEAVRMAGEAQDGIVAARGRFLAVLDGGDVWSANWLRAALAAAVDAERPTIWHPEASLLLGDAGGPCWLRHPDSEDEDGDWATLAMRDHWPVGSFAARTTHIELLEAGDRGWAWNMEALSRGYLHKPVIGTVHLRRQALTAAALPPRSGLLAARVGYSSPDLSRSGLSSPALR